MRVHLTHKRRAPYAGYDFATFFGEGYHERLDELLSRITYGTFHGSDLLLEDPPGLGMPIVAARLAVQAKNEVITRYRRRRPRRAGRQPLKPFWPEEDLRLPRYFSDRSEAAGILGGFVDALFTGAAHRAEKPGWVEKTPANLLYADALLELVPDAFILHAYRHPAGVVHSLQKHHWAPDSLEKACHFIGDVMRRWLDLRDSLPPELRARVLEIRTEEMSRDPSSEFNRIADFCGIAPSFGPLPDIQPDFVDYWRKEMSNEERATIERLLGDVMQAYGYEA
jgi:hypothetical protein